MTIKMADAKPPEIRLTSQHCTAEGCTEYEAWHLPSDPPFHHVRDRIEIVQRALFGAGWWLIRGQWLCASCGWAKVVRSAPGTAEAVRMAEVFGLPELVGFGRAA